MLDVIGSEHCLRLLLREQVTLVGSLSLLLCRGPAKGLLSVIAVTALSVERAAEFNTRVN